MCGTRHAFRLLTEDRSLANNLASSRETKEPEFLELPDGWLHISTGSVYVHGRILSLTSIEQALLAHLASHTPDPVSKPELLGQVWGYSASVDSHTLKTTISRLRRKLGSSAKALSTITRLGYCLRGSSALSPPHGEVTLALLSMPSPLRTAPKASMRAALQELDRILEAAPAPRAFAFLDSPFHLGLAFDEPRAAIDWAVAAMESCDPENPGAISIAPASSVTPPHYAGPDRERVEWLGRAASRGEITVDEAIEIPPHPPRTQHLLVRPRSEPRPEPKATPFPPRLTVWGNAPKDKRPRMPRWSTTWVGREADLERLARLFQQGSRLVTVAGPGGMGKTRLAVRYAQTLPDGLFVDLVGANQLGEILERTGHALGIHGSSRPISGIIKTIGAALHNRSAVAVFDNAEHCLPGMRHLLGTWMEQADDCRFLVTSRARLGLEGEWVHDLKPMNEADARTLLQQRASAAMGGDVPDNEVLLDLAHQLDGLPLAVELAACQVASLGLTGVIERMHNRFSVLRNPDRADRHATLDAVIRSSWDRLCEPTREALAQCSVFAGPFTVQAAQQVLALSQPDAPSVQDAIHALVQQSLIQHLPGQISGLDLLGSIRAFAAEQLAETEAKAARERHATWALGLTIADSESGALSMPTARIAALLAHRAEVYAAIHHVAPAQPKRALDALEAMRTLRNYIGPSAAFVRATDLLVNTTRSSLPRLQARALRLRGSEWQLRNSFPRARMDLETATTLARTVGDERTETLAAYALICATPPYRGRSHRDRVLALLPRIQKSAGTIEYVNVLSNLLLRDGLWDREFCAEIAARAERAHAQHGGDVLALRVHTIRGRMLTLTKDLQGGLVHHRMALQLATRLGRRWDVAHNEYVIGASLAALGHRDEAVPHLERSIAEARAMGQHASGASSELAACLMRMGRWDEAEALYQSHARAIANDSLPAARGVVAGCLGEMAELRGDPRAAIARYEEALSRLGGREDKILHTYFVIGLAGAKADAGSAVEAVALLRSVDGLAEDTSPDHQPRLLCTYGRLRALRSRHLTGAGADRDRDVATRILNALEACPMFDQGSSIYVGCTLLRRALRANGPPLGARQRA